MVNQRKDGLGGSMPRFYLSNPVIEEGRLRIEGPEVRHIRRVLRLKKGEDIVLFNGQEKEYRGIIVEQGTHRITVQIEQILSIQRESPLEITIAQSLLKGEKMDYFIQKATELGVTRIVPFFSSRSVPLLDKSKRLSRHRRWQRIAIEASKQCGRVRVPEVIPLQDFSEMLQLPSPGACRLILWENEKRGLKNFLKGSKCEREIFFIVGPEGGFSEGEIENAKKSGFIPIGLGERILRAETAGLCLLSILQYEWGDIG